MIDLDRVVGFRVGQHTYTPDEVTIVMVGDDVVAHAGVAEVGAAVKDDTADE